MERKTLLRNGRPMTWRKTYWLLCFKRRSDMTLSESQTPVHGMRIT